jgi:hypothetical protein
VVRTGPAAALVEPRSACRARSEQAAHLSQHASRTPKEWFRALLEPRVRHGDAGLRRRPRHRHVDCAGDGASLRAAPRAGACAQLGSVVRGQARGRAVRRATRRTVCGREHVLSSNQRIEDCAHRHCANLVSGGHRTVRRAVSHVTPRAARRIRDPPGRVPGATGARRRLLQGNGRQNGVLKSRLGSSENQTRPAAGRSTCRFWAGM